ncbi:MAG: hypothetical protein R3190_08145, partial [Thermoanaerobaculia bacterium]|nr:hypothetical protein [Thermoanaerobaculia bacterium]
ILGALYMIAPMALRARLAAGRADWVAFWSWTIGVVGMVSHFWIDQISGMVWAAAMVILTLAFLGGRVALVLRPAPIARGVKLHFVLAFVNIVAAGTFGGLIGLNKLVPVLPGFVLTNVYAHAHLAGVGWALMTVMGAAYRLLPMLLPAQLPGGARVAVSAVLVEVGVVGLFAGLHLRSALVAPSALVVIAGIGAFLTTVGWMRAHRRRPAKGLPRPDLGVIQVFVALAYLVLAAGLGLALAAAPEAAWKVTVAGVYGVVALLGFLGQMIVGVNLRLFPLFAWLHLAQDGRIPSSPQRFSSPGRAVTVTLPWNLAVPMLVVALFVGAASLAWSAGLLLLVATVASVALQRSTLARLRP